MWNTPAMYMAASRSFKDTSLMSDGTLQAQKISKLRLSLDRASRILEFPDRPFQNLWALTAVTRRS